MDSMLCINAKNLTKSYGNIMAVNGITISVDSGLVFGFLGPNGAGKSTTIKLLTTLIRPSSGSLTIMGINALEHPVGIRQKIGVVLQQPSYEPTLTVEKSLDKYGMMWGIARQQRRKRMEQLLKDFDLHGIRKIKNEDLSIGQRRQVQVAREFMHDMELMFLDEPTVGLDPAARRRLLDYLKNKAKTGMTIFYTTHVLSEAEYLCDKIAIIDRGKILAVDTPDGLKNKFKKEKTITISLLKSHAHLDSLLHDVADCKISHSIGTDITINSDESELILQQVLRILIDNNLQIENITATSPNIEDVFLRLVQGHASNN